MSASEDGNLTATGPETAFDAQEFFASGFSALDASIDASNSIPSGTEFQYLSTYGEFRNTMNSLGQKMLKLAQNLVNTKTADVGVTKPSLLEITDSSDAYFEYEKIRDVIDGMVERAVRIEAIHEMTVDVISDEIKGVVPETAITVSKTAFLGLNGSRSFQYASNVLRPQEKWKDDIDNSTSPFVPRIRSKLNAKVPLDASILSGKLNPIEISDPDMREHITGTHGVALIPDGFPHPYEYELLHLEYPHWCLKHRPDQKFLPLEITPVTYVDTEAELKSLAEYLDKQTEIAIDLEAHQYRSFQGFTCLMQISTRRDDFIVDTLALRKSMFVLNSSFTNPSIVKVLHGSESDIQWLQRDFGLYIVNMFDTGQAARVLELPSYALSYLLKYYCGVNADKQYQKADWRIRPLPEPMLKYAREDTHYLLYVYDRLRNELLTRSTGHSNLLLVTLQRSRDLCLKRYEKEKCTETSYLTVLTKYYAQLSIQQTEVFAAVYNWRDAICRIEDESTRYVLPNHMILLIADKMPEDDKSLQECCVPVPPLVKMNLPELLKVVKDAKSRGAILQQSTAINNPHLLRTSSPSTSGGYNVSTTSSTNLPDTSLQVTSSDELCRKAGWYASDVPHAVFPPSANKPLITSSTGMPTSNFFLSSVTEEDPLTLTGRLELSQDADARMTANQIKNSFSVDWMNRLPIDTSIASALGNFGSNSTNSSTNLTASINTVAPAATVAHGSAYPSQASINLIMPDHQQQQQYHQNPNMNNISNNNGNDYGNTLFSGLPQSMEEIYNMSNQTRRVKKKRDAEPINTADPSSPFYLQDGDSTLDIRAAKRAKTAETDSSNAQFLHDIGWAETPTKLHSGSNSGESPQPFDYTKHREHRPAPGYAQQAASRGKTSEASLNPYGNSQGRQKQKKSGNSGSGGGGIQKEDQPITHRQNRGTRKAR